MKTWKENVSRVKAFYDSDYYNTLRTDNVGFVRSVVKALMLDPDSVDTELYEEKAAQLSDMNLTVGRVSAKDGETTLGMDCVIGWKALFRIHRGESTWIDDYALIRSNLNAHLLWPRHEGGTINTVRASVFKDRIDYTLYDIKQFYETDDCSQLMLAKAYSNPLTYNWLHQFSSFEELVTKMKLACFCDDELNVLDLGLPNTPVISEYMDGYNVVGKRYLQNLKHVLGNQNK